MARPWRPPEHPNVTWGATTPNRVAYVTCDFCGIITETDANSTAWRIRHQRFTARCYKDRLRSPERKDRAERPAHPAIDWSDRVVVNGATKVLATCPKCSRSRRVQVGSTEAHIRAGRWTGLCATCSPKAKKREWTRLGPGRKLDPVKGYIWLSLKALSPSDRALADGLRGARTFVLEHRLVMSRVLGRPLRSNELVDHMDGIKTNNDPANLRLYVRGKNQPGETSGYGTYYDEWQRAKARVRELEDRIANALAT